MYNEKDVIAQWNADMYDLNESYTDDVELALMLMGVAWQTKVPISRTKTSN